MVIHMASKSLYEEYEGLVKKRTLFLFSLTLLLLILTIVSISIGSVKIPLSDVIKALITPLFSKYFKSNILTLNVIWNLRLPRTIMAILTGACFGVAGCILQVTLRNPLASPYTIGVASSAAFGAALAIILGAGITGWGGQVMVYKNPYFIVFNAFTLSMICSLIIMALSLYKGASPGTTILAGISMTYLFSALTSLLQYFGTTEQIAAVVFWVFGDLGKAEWFDVAITASVLFILVPMVFIFSSDYNAVLAGDETAASLGVNVRRLRIMSLAVASLLTATPVSFIGTIGFVGLLAPHIARMAIGSDHRFLIPSALLTGSILLLAADAVSRTIVSPLILPVGIVTAFMGVPLFLYLLLSRREKYW